MRITACTFIYMRKGSERTESLRRTCNIIRHLLTECTTVIKCVWIASKWYNDGTYLRIGQGCSSRCSPLLLFVCAARSMMVACGLSLNLLLSQVANRRLWTSTSCLTDKLVHTLVCGGCTCVSAPEYARVWFNSDARRCYQSILEGLLIRGFGPFYGATLISRPGARARGLAFTPDSIMQPSSSSQPLMINTHLNVWRLP
jgi:hypothetical protein